MKDVSVVAVRYLEPAYRYTEQGLAKLDVPVIHVDRDGTGSLAQALNTGITYVDTELAWLVTNVQFGARVLRRLRDSMGKEYAAVQPAYPSDHPHLWPNGSNLREDVPYVEFTCPLVRTSVLLEHPLDEAMPYWGHDLDWSHRVKEAGWRLGVAHGVTVAHQYLRHGGHHPVTEERRVLRKASDQATTDALVAKYGDQWRRVLGWK